MKSLPILSTCVRTSACPVQRMSSHAATDLAILQLLEDLPGSAGPFDWTWPLSILGLEIISVAEYRFASTPVTNEIVVQGFKTQQPSEIL